MRNASDTIRTKTQDIDGNAPMHRPMRQASRQVRNIDQLHAIVEAATTHRGTDEEGMFIVPMSFGYYWADPESPGTDAPTPRLALWLTWLPRDARQSFSIANHVSLSKWISRTA